MRDILGTIHKVIDEDGVIVVKYSYDECGQVDETILSNLNGAKYNPFKYKGYYYDVETGLFMMGQRYYSPELCRFIQPDSIEYLDPSSINGLNLYCYCFNNPIMYYDPSGHSALLVLASVLYLGLMGAAASVTVQAITDIVQGNEFDINNYLIAGVSGFVGGALGFINPYLGSIAQGMLSTGLSMGYKEYQGKANYDFLDYTVALIVSGLVSGFTTLGFRKIVNNTNAFETARIFGDDLPTWFDCGNEVFFEMLWDLTPYYLTYSLTNSACGLFFAGIPEYAREVVALKRLGLSWGQAFKYAF